MSQAAVDPELLRAMEGVMSLLDPGPYGVADSDPKVQVIRDVASVISALSKAPVVIGGVAVLVNGYARQTADLDLLVARGDALPLVRALEASGRFRRKAIDRWVHIDTGTGLDLCVEGELTHPSYAERFPAPDSLETISKAPLAVVGLVDLLVLKAKSARTKDWADFVTLAKLHGLQESLRTAVTQRIVDARVRQLVEGWWEQARTEAARETSQRATWTTEAPPRQGDGV